MKFNVKRSTFNVERSAEEVGSGQWIEVSDRPKNKHGAKC